MHSGEPRTSEADTPKAAIAQDVENVQLHGKVAVEGDIAVDESSIKAVIEVKKQHWKDAVEQLMKDEIASMPFGRGTFEEREIQRKHWMEVFDSSSATSLTCTR